MDLEAAASKVVGARGRWRRALTPRQAEVLRLYCLGWQHKAIGHALGLSIHTIKRHLHDLRTSVDLDDRASLLAFAVDRGLLDDLVRARAQALRLARIKRGPHTPRAFRRARRHG